MCVRGVCGVWCFHFSMHLCSWGAFVVHSERVLVQGGGVCARMCMEMCVGMLVQRLHLGLLLLMGGSVQGGWTVQDSVCV